MTIINLILKIHERFSDWVRDKASKSQATTGKNTKFSSSSRVINIQNNRSKITLGDNCRIKGELLVFNSGGNIKIGNNVFIGESSKLWSGESIIIGNDVLISHNVNIIDTNSHEMNHLVRAKSYLDLITNGHAKDTPEVLTAPINISNHVWISFGVTILKGVTIGEGAIIAANSVITKDVAPYSLMGGNPAKQIKSLKTN